VSVVEARDVVIDVNGLDKSFGTNKVLDKIDFKVHAGEMVGLIGASGSGKSTLLRLIGGLEVMDQSGQYIKVLGEETQIGNKQTPHHRQVRRTVGMIFQHFNLVGRLSLLTNVLIGRLAHNPAWRGWLSLFPKAEKIKALEALERVNMIDFAHQRASTLSGGQQQRGAIARALAQEAKIILADEPIASLDPASSERVMDLLAEINSRDNNTVVVSLHQFEVAAERCSRIVALRKGHIVYDGPPAAIGEKDLIELYGVVPGSENDEEMLEKVA